MNTDLITPMFQPLRGETGSIWCAIEYGITTDNSSFISADSTAEREDTDEEIMSFDLGPEPFDPHSSRIAYPRTSIWMTFNKTHTWGFGAQSDKLRPGNWMRCQLGHLS